MEKMHHAEYLSKHGGSFVDELLNGMELSVDNSKPDFIKWFYVMNSARKFANAVWRIYRTGKKQGI